MHIEADTLDDLMNDVFKKLVELPFDIKTTRGEENGNSSEIIGVLLELKNPLARLSRTETKGTLFSALGETLWYLSADNKLDFIKYYIGRYKDESEDGESIYGGYGPRLYNYRDTNQVQNIINLLTKKPSSRRAVVQLFGAEDLANSHLEIPCTCTLQFFIRDNSLHLVTYMRSNDCYWGLPHDIFAFTMLQEIIARTLNVKLGTYKHSVGSLHLYESKHQLVRQYLAEGLQPTKKFMPAMPSGSPDEAIKVLLDLEQRFRNYEEVDINSIELDQYWLDLALLLQVFALKKQKKFAEIEHFKNKIQNPDYRTFIDNRISAAKERK